jgi:ribosomal protein L24
MIKRHTRPNPSRQIKGGIAEKESMIAVSNVMVLTSGGVPTRVGYKIEGSPACPSGGFASLVNRASHWIGKVRGSAWQARLREHYRKNVVPALTKEFGYKNVMAVPKIDKVSVNIGLGEATQNAKLMDGAVNELTARSRDKNRW